MEKVETFEDALVCWSSYYFHAQTCTNMGSYSMSHLYYWLWSDIEKFLKLHFYLKHITKCVFKDLIFTIQCLFCIAADTLVSCFYVYDNELFRDNTGKLSLNRAPTVGPWDLSLQFEEIMWVHKRHQKGFCLCISLSVCLAVQLVIHHLSLRY